MRAAHVEVDDALTALLVPRSAVPLVWHRPATYRRLMWVALLRVVLATLVVAVVLVALLGGLFGWYVWRRPVAAVRAWRERRRPPPPETRPIEELAVVARRLGRRFHEPPAGQRFAKTEGLRQAYDAVLTEACTALGLTHLLMVLPAGSDLDAERARVEWALEVAGLELGLSL
ncbi:MAG: hypothetical protein ACR2JD_07385 [Nocardioides sp.]